MNADCYGRPGTKAERLRSWCHDAVQAHRDEGTIPTTGRFLFYEAVMTDVISKASNGHGGRRPDQDLTDALTWLREHDLVGWDELIDRTRGVSDYRGHRSVRDAALDAAKKARLDRWDGTAPLLVVESESLAGLFDNIAYEYTVPLVPVRGQSSASLLVNDVAPCVEAGSVVLYVGDYDKAGFDIEHSAWERLERFTGEALDWQRVALTEEQVAQHGLPLVERTDRRDRLTRRVAECEAMPQATLMRLVTDALDALEPDDVRERERGERQRILAALDVSDND